MFSPVKPYETKKSSPIKDDLIADHFTSKDAEIGEIRISKSDSMFLLRFSNEWWIDMNWFYIGPSIFVWALDLKVLNPQEEHWWKMRKTYVAEPWISKNKEKPLTGKVRCPGKRYNQLHGDG